jgi:hypothetical protein
MAPRGNAGLTFYPLVTIPKPLDIVWCRFPQAEKPKVPGPKSRPGLVRSLALNKNQTKAVIEVTYGTSKLKGLDRRLDLHIQNLSCIEACGLERATRFDLDRTIWMPWAEEYFAPPPGYSRTIIGSLDPNSMMQLEALKVARRAMRSRPRRS